jgi:hypothetical protein
VVAGGSSLRRLWPRREGEEGPKEEGEEDGEVEEEEGEGIRGRGGGE